jgi:hypothetical protein
MTSDRRGAQHISSLKGREPMHEQAYYPSLFTFEIVYWKQNANAVWTGTCIVYYNSTEVDRLSWKHKNVDVLHGMAYAHFLAVRAMYCQPDLPSGFKVEGSDDEQLPLFDDTLNPD